MKTRVRTPKAPRAGRWLDRACYEFLRFEDRTIKGLAKKGIPANVMRILFGMVKLFIVVVVLPTGFWLISIFALATLATLLTPDRDIKGERLSELRHSHPTKFGHSHTEEFRQNYSSMGFYAEDDRRIDRRDPKGQ